MEPPVFPTTSPSRASSAFAPTERHEALATAPTTGAHLLLQTAESRRPFGSGERRDLVADVHFYASARALYDGDEEAMREAGILQPRLGKYALTRVFGHGAKGAVLLGRNDDLGVDVAVKVLRRDPSRADDPREGVRLRREAQALAQLTHPNVVPIYDAGEANGEIFIVMQFVRGATLRQAQAGKSWPEILDLYVAVARGLAAVHRAGLVHRDVKPDNILVDETGRVMLADFGLACLVDDPSPDLDVRAHRELQAGAFAAAVTRTYEIHGTPAYMAPEQFDGHADPRSDLFSLCASLFEALHGVLPFQADTIWALPLAAREGNISPRPPTSRVPRWLDQVVRRGLAGRPELRQPSLDVLIADLDHRGRRRRRILTLTTLTVGATIASLLVLALRGAPPPDPCAAPETRLAPVWSDTARTALAARGDDGVRLAGLLDPHAASWTRSFAAVCQATHHQGTQSPDLHEVRMTCLDDRRRDLAAIVDAALSPGASDPLAGLIEAAARLHSPDRCRSVTLTPNPTPEQAAALLPVREALTAARLDEHRGEYHAARDRAVSALATARAIGFAPVLAEALALVGSMRALVGDVPGARHDLEEALDLAEIHGLDALAFDANNRLLELAILDLRDTSLAHAWARQAGRKLRRLAPEDPWRTAELFNNRGLLAFHLEGDSSAATDLHRDALARRTALGEAGHEVRLVLSDSHINLGNALIAAGDLDQGKAHYDASIALQTEVLGPRHPQLAQARFNIALDLRVAGRLDEALAAARDALQLLEDRGLHNLLRAKLHYLLSVIAAERGDLEVALAEAEATFGAVERIPGPRGIDRAWALDRLAAVLRERGELDRSLATFDAALAALAAAPERDDTITGTTLNNRADVLLSLGRAREALAEHSRALELFRSGSADAAQHIPFALKGIGLAHIELGDPNAALAPLREAAALLGSTGDAALAAEVQLLLERIDHHQTRTEP